MPLNETHKNILEGTLRFIFDDIYESAPPEVGCAAHEIIKVAADVELADNIQMSTVCNSQLNELTALLLSIFHRANKLLRGVKSGAEVKYGINVISISVERC